MSTTFAGLLELIRVNNFHLILLQEVRLTNDELNCMVSRLGYSAEVNIDIEVTSRPGTAVIWKDLLPVDNVVTIVPSRAQAVVLGSLIIFNVYGPSGSDKKKERNIFFGHDMFTAFQLFPNSDYILSGDFNCLLSPLDVENGTGFKQKLCLPLKDLIFSHSLVDIFRLHNPRVQEFTFFRPGKAASRLDRFYASLSLSESARVTHIASLSDHCGTYLKLSVDLKLLFRINIRRTTYWKLNTAILHEDDFLPSFTKFWKDISKSKSLYNDIADWWDLVAKPEIKQFCINFSSLRKHKRNDTLMFLFSYLKVVLADKNWLEVGRIRERIKQMLFQDSMGVIVRSQYQQNSEEEKGSLFHAARENKIVKIT